MFYSIQISKFKLIAKFCYLDDAPCPDKLTGARMESGLRYIQIELFIVSSREMSSFRDRDTGRQFAASCQSATRKRTPSR